MPHRRRWWFQLDGSCTETVLNVLIMSVCGRCCNLFNLFWKKVNSQTYFRLLSTHLICIWILLIRGYRTFAFPLFAPVSLFLLMHFFKLFFMLNNINIDLGILKVEFFFFNYTILSSNLLRINAINECVKK
jgi:hypothetical protein